MSDNIVFPRGAKTARVKTARIAVGARLLTSPARVHPDYSSPTQQKTGAIVRVVESINYQMHQGTGFHGRAGRTYTVHFTDGTKATDLAPIFTWHALVTDTESSASRQHFIDAGYYLTEAEVAEFAGQA